MLIEKLRRLGRHDHRVLWKGGGAPDQSGLNAAALEQAKLSREALDWYKQIYSETAPERAAAEARANQISDVQLEQMNFATDEAKRISQRNQSLFEPLENDLVADAKAYDTPERRAAAQAGARADIEQSFGSAQDANAMAIRRTGGTVGGGRSMALIQDFALNKAKALAGATTAASKGVEQQGYARKMDAAALGKGLVGNQATMQQLAASAGGLSAGASGQALGAATSGAGIMGQGFQQGMQGHAQAGQLFGQAASNMQQWQASKNAQQASTVGAIGQAAGMVGMYML